MNINPRSQIHKFMTLSFTGSNRDSSIPTNLCPYMRNFILHLLMSVIFYGFIILSAYAALMAPVLWFTRGPLDAFIIVLILGTMIDVFLIIAGLVWLIQRTKLDKPVSKFAEKTAIRIHKSLFWQWGIAVHDKICPEVTFHED